MPVETTAIFYPACDLATLGVYNIMVTGLAPDVANAFIGPYLDGDFSASGWFPLNFKGRA